MKTLYKSLVILATATLTLAACSQKEVINTPKENELVTLKFNIRNADNENLTKALLGTESGKNFLNWENDDKIGTFSVGSFSQGNNSYTTSNNNAGNVVVSGNDYTLNVQTFYDGTVTNVYSYFPYSSGAGKEKTAAVVTIPETQRMTELGFDADAMPMAGEPVSVNLTTTANTDEPCGTINFSNLGSIIKFRVYTTGSTSETLTSVTYKATGVGGAFTIDLTRIDATDETTLALTPSETVNELTTTVAGNPAISDLDHAIDVYMVVAPDTYSNSQVVVTTNAHTYTLNASGEKTFTRSHVKPIKVDISKGTPGELPKPETWTKVTSSSDFTPGTYYILRADGAYYVPNAIGNPSCVSYAAGDPISNAMKWTATTSGSGLQFESVSNAGYYLWTTNTGNANTISVAETSTGANASKIWSFAEVEANSTTYYTATAGAKKYLVSYGTSNWRYYATSSISASNIPAEFYKLVVNDNRTPVTLAFPQTPAEFTNEAGSYDQFLGYDVTATDDQDNDVTSSITSSALLWSYEDNDGVIDEFDKGALTLTGTAGTATVKVSFSGDENYLPAAEVSYTITVTDTSTPPAPTTGWVETALANLTTSDVFVIVGNNGDNYAMSNDGGTTNQPAAVAVNVSGSVLTGTIAENIKWNISGNATDGYTFYPNGNSTLWLYCTNANNGVRVGTNNAKVFIIDGGYLKHSGTNRYVGIYNSQDWRCYTSSDGNIANQTFKFYRYVEAPDTRDFAPISWSSNSGSATWSSSGISSTLPSLSNTSSLAVSYDSSDKSVATIANDGTVSIVGEGSTVISATYDGSDSSAPYKTTTVSYTLTVTDNRTACATPTFSPAAGEVTSGSEITISSTTAGATIYYTTGSSEFSAGDWTEYTAPIAVTTACTIKAIATAVNYKNSEVSSAAYTIAGSNPVTETFIFNTDAGIAALGITKPSTGEGTDLVASYKLGGVTMAVTNGSTNTRVWNSNGTLDLRIYKSGGSLTFSVASDKVITSIVISGSATNVFTVDSGSYSSGTWTPAANTPVHSVKFTANNTGKINTIAVTYE